MSSGFNQRWGPEPGDGDKIWAHLLRQRDLDPLKKVRLDNGRVVRVGEREDDDDVDH